jgi:hypothetical protein
MPMLDDRFWESINSRSENPFSERENADETTPTLNERFWESFSFWLCACLGTVAAGGVFGLVLGIIYSIEGHLMALLLCPPGGILIAGIGSCVLHSHFAILAWAFSLSRYRLLLAGIAGGLVGLIAAAVMYPNPLLAVFVRPEVIPAGLLGALGSGLAAYRYSKSDASQNVRSTESESPRWQFSVRDLWIRFTILAVVISAWATLITIAVRSVRR